MDINELITILTEGLDEAQKASVTAAIQRDNVKAKVSGLKAQAEFDRIASERAQLLAELEGDAAAKVPGTRAYRDWYAKNSNRILLLDEASMEFEKKHGAGSFEKFARGGFQVPSEASAQGAAPLTEEQISKLIQQRIDAGAKPAVAEADIQRMVDARIQGAYAPKWSELLTDTGTIVQKHMFSGRKTPIDFKKLSEIAQSKNVPLEAAYDEWDKPERDRLAAEATEKEIQRRVNEEIQKRGAAQVPAGADMTPGNLSAHKDADKFDRNALMREMVTGWTNAGTVTQ